MISPSSQNNPDKLNIVVLYDHTATHVSTTAEYLDAFRKYSRHNVYYVPATRYVWARAKSNETKIDFSLFDVVIVHYSIRLIYQDHIDEGIAAQLTAYDGLKLLFIQDEHERTETTRQWMERLQFDIIYTGVPEEGRAQIYPRQRFPKTGFRQVLNGYLPDDPLIETYALPIEQRKIWIGYRGRVLSYRYGALSREKYTIGVEVKKLAKKQEIPVDIGVTDKQRIYGRDWYRFLGSVRATLGTESGSNVFDFDGSIEKTIAQAIAKNPNIPFEEVQRTILAPHEGLVVMNQISPKIFEAIQLRTVLILFEGHYSGIVKPDIHYIPLKKDFSNIDDVFKKLGDIDFLKNITDRAYRDIVESGVYSYRRFIENIDADINIRVVAGPRYELIPMMIMGRAKNNSLRLAIPQKDYGHFLNTAVLGNGLHASELAQAMNFYSHPPSRRILQAVYDLAVKKPARLVYREIQRRHGIVYYLLRPVYRSLPRSIRENLLRQSAE